jgi:hypothetical protein
VNHFSIFAHGENFDVDSYIQNAALKPDHVWRRGDQKSGTDGGEFPKSSGVKYILGDGNLISPWDQELQAIEFLTNHCEALQALNETAGVTTFILGLQYNARLGPSTIGFSVGASTLLMWHIVNVGAEFRVYVTL